MTALEVSTTEPIVLAPLPEFSLAETFFASAIQSQSLAHAYVLKGRQSDALYQLALSVAQVVNCKQRPALQLGASLKQLACGQCQDCRWVMQNAHPAVLTVSRMTYQVQDKEHPDLLSSDELEKMAQKSAWPTQIKTSQMGRLIQQLGVSSEYNRVVIFTDAEELPLALFPARVPAPGEWRSLEATQDRAFHIRPLERSIFNANSVNRFLKTLEEPPPRTLFFFITETEEQLLETIVSRCQVVPCFSAVDEGDSGLLGIPVQYQAFFTTFWERLQLPNDVFALSAEFEAFFVKEHGLNMSQALEMLQQVARERLHAQPIAPERFQAYRRFQQAVNLALRMLASKTNEGATLVNLWLSLGAIRF